MGTGSIAVIGGGAAGSFAAIAARAHHPKARISILEKSDKVLAKVRISGGGRCNVTHDQPLAKRFAQHYPRGERFLRKVFEQFAMPQTVAWFAAHGVPLKTEADGRMFPVTDDSATIVDRLLASCTEGEVDIVRHARVIGMQRVGVRYRLQLAHGAEQVHDKVIVAAGGHPTAPAYAWLERLGHTVVPPVPSLFTFNLEQPMKELMGVVAPHARVRIEGTGLEAEGSVLITHWGLSGPAVLRLSAWGARELNARDYRYVVRVNWTGTNEAEVRLRMIQESALHGGRTLANASPFELPRRLWSHLLERVGIDAGRPLSSLGRKDRDRLIDLLVNDRHAAAGKTTFKEEFVTAGGISLNEVDPVTMESRVLPGVHFAGEVLDIDGITGGFNFQAAWSTGWIAGRSAALGLE